MKYEIVFDYKENESLRKSFNELSEKTFGINFEEWYQKKLWNDRYVCYSIKTNDKIVSNISVNKFEFVIDGKIKKALQIGTVMTDEEYRGRGLSGQLMKFVLDEYENKYDLPFLPVPE